MIRIQQASLADADVLARLNQHVHRLHTDNASRFFRQPSLEEVASFFKESLARERTRALIAYADDVPVGYVVLIFVERLANPFSPPRRWLYVDQISVEPEWERHGVGTQLLESAVQQARTAGMDELEIDTWSFNTKAKAFFKGFGFQPKTERFWMQIGEEAS
jgi:GNAT superfamily N-acetyltransferase